MNARHRLETKRANKTLDRLYKAENNKIVQRILKTINNKTINKDKKRGATNTHTHTHKKENNTAQQQLKSNQQSC